MTYNIIRLGLELKFDFKYNNGNIIIIMIIRKKIGSTFNSTFQHQIRTVKSKVRARNVRFFILQTDKHNSYWIILPARHEQTNEKEEKNAMARRVNNIH